MKKFENKEEILEYAKNLENKTALEVLDVQMEYNVKKKGQFGSFKEEKYYGIKNNNERRPDLHKQCVELKITPEKQIKNKTY